jgi:hypothetical protein
VGLAVLQAIVQHAPLCLRVQWQPDQLIHLGAGAVTALLDMLRYKRFTSQRRPASDNAASRSGCPELGGDVPGLVGVRAVYQRLSWLACMAAHDASCAGDNSVLLSL